jgi:hypothetical protein
VDVTVEYTSLDKSIDPFDTKISRTACDKYTEILRVKLAEHTNNVIRPHFETLLSQLSEKPTTALNISADGEKLFIPYPSRFGKDESVLLEFGGRNVILPNEDRHLRPYIAAELPNLHFPEATVRVLSPTRTFWEKATLIHVACNRANPKLDADRQSRHWHDLAILADHEIGKIAIPDRQLLADVAKHKSVFFRASYANYEACVSGGLCLVPEGTLRDALYRDYEKMIADGMFEGDPPNFESNLMRLQALEKQINAV